MQEGTADDEGPSVGGDGGVSVEFFTSALTGTVWRNCTCPEHPLRQPHLAHTGREWYRRFEVSDETALLLRIRYDEAGRQRREHLICI